MTFRLLRQALQCFAHQELLIWPATSLILLPYPSVKFKLLFTSMMQD